VLVVGSKNSSNSNRLREVAELRGVPAYLVDNADGIDPAWIESASAASASPPAHRRRKCWSNR
jgi:4-hydroxy-3-methylbut-2-enyl diphosphate reductase IspH